MPALVRAAMASVGGVIKIKQPDFELNKTSFDMLAQHLLVYTKCFWSSFGTERRIRRTEVTVFFVRSRDARWDQSADPL